MDKSDDIEAISKALAKFQEYLSAPKKNKDNPFFKSKYAGLDDDISAIKEVQTAHPDLGISYTQDASTSDSGLPQVKTTIHHISGEYLMFGPLTLPVAKKDAQGYGSALTYARRYSLEAAFGIASEDDDGNGASDNRPDQSTRPSQHQPRQQKPSEPLASQQDVEELETLVTDFAGKDGTSPKVVYQNIFTSAKVQNKRLNTLTQAEMGALKRAMSQLMG